MYYEKSKLYFLIAGIAVIIVAVMTVTLSSKSGKLQKSKPILEHDAKIIDTFNIIRKGHGGGSGMSTSKTISGNSANVNYSLASSKLENLDLIMISLEASNSKFEPKLVDMQIELAKVFSPDNFDCIGGKLKEKIKKMQVKSKDGRDKADGFVPKEVEEMVKEYPNSYLIGTGANYLAHSFTYVNASTKKESNLLVAGDAPSYEDFALDDYIIKGKHDIPYLIYIMDCSGYFSAAISAAGGAGGNDIKASADMARNSESNLAVISCVMISPLFSAYDGSKPLQKDDKATFLRRISIMKSVLKKLPFDNKNLIINLKENYFVLLCSNSKTGSFNGTVNANANVGVGFGFGSASASTAGNGKLSRTMEFDNFQTYILDNSIGSEFRPIPARTYSIIFHNLIRQRNCHLPHLLCSA
ncbi:hypothetical protein NLG42_19630 [Flavobacterium plurextorum]|uniref:hypothetical protein n=1 Tax=Flavobacterium TaxID=237 RepID=UPI00214DA519|nr:MULTISPECIES: hypothetical protein [Flavobacterium]UUW08306.1 hypothetical protein NLG42_19630 [Flavobacterium plurextorum]